MTSSSGDASYYIELDEWEDRVVERNRQNEKFDRIMEDVVFQAASMSFQHANYVVRAQRCVIERKREKGHERLFEQYFSNDSIYPPKVFRTRFRMQKSLFERIMNIVVASDEFFEQKRDAVGRLGMSSIQKCTASIRVLAYGTGADLHDDYLRMSAQVIRKSIKKFVHGVISNFGEEYLRASNEEDMTYLLQVGEECGFPGSRNDINVLEQSSIFNDILKERAPKINYMVNGHEYNMRYYLTDGIYPRWTTFVKSINAPQIQKHQLFAQHQEAARKDVEQAFGVLQARFIFLKRPCLIWDRDMMGKIMIACIIMHNMIVEDERHSYLNYRDPTEFMDARPTPNSTP